MHRAAATLCLVLLASLCLSDANVFRWLLGRLRPGQRRGEREALAAAGLHNMGNTCYLNSVLQGLFHVQAFRERMLESRFSKSSVGGDLQSIFRDLCAKQNAVDTEELVARLGINVAIQEDAQEFYLRLVNSLNSGKEATKAGPDDVFTGETEQVIQCLNVDYKKQKKQKFLDLSVDATSSDRLEDSLHMLFSEKEQIEHYKTPDHGQQAAEKSLSLSRLPKALCLHLKRFHFDAATESIVKVGKRVSFPVSLDLAQYLPRASAEDKTSQAPYELAAIVVHEGTATRGHYTCFARPDLARAPEAWVRLNDHAVSRVSQETVLEESFGDSDVRGPASKNAYLLFYVAR